MYLCRFVSWPVCEHEQDYSENLQNKLAAYLAESVPCHDAKITSCIVGPYISVMVTLTSIVLTNSKKARTNPISKGVVGVGVVRLVSICPTRCATDKMLCMLITFL